MPQLHDYGESQRTLARVQLAWLDAQLKDKEFIAGSRFTIADIHGSVTIDFAIRAGIILEPGLKEVTRWHRAISSGPSATTQF
jgi:glutathione S-transferase